MADETPPEAPPDEQPPAEVKPPAIDLIQLASNQADRLEKGNKELAELLAKQEQLQVEQKLGGRTDAGQQEQTKEEKEIEDAKKLLKGSGFEDVVFPTKKQ